MIKTARLLIFVLALFSSFQLQVSYSAVSGAGNRRNTVEEEIWVLEKAYFESLYKADYQGVLAITHNQFLGWPGTLPQPIDKEGSARFMEQLIIKPTSCILNIEREGIRLVGEVALTQYIIHVDCSDASSAVRTQSSRITHTWVRDGDSWKLLGGMSYNQ